MSTLKSLRNHLAVLEERHRVLDKKIVNDYNHHLNDSDLTAEKLEKLELKHEIEDLKITIREKEESGDK